MANTIKAYIYTDNQGVQHVYGVNQEIFTQQGVALTPKIGGAVYTGAPKLASFPRNWRTRKARLVNPAGKVRYITCLTPNADLFTGVETTLNIEDSDGTSTVYTVNGTLGEASRTRHP